ncbi:protein kinase domain-containing protein [Nocardioides flavescens]|uniref:non-specific serine/threonine protein kinase n=1 Tax=Nocardioides flavescens TaxID=2691959 RepID=A0A6L7F2E8_9ACTN|nr:protein kinase [Nocardioides flavescens]
MSDDSAWRPPSPVGTADEALEGYADLVEVGRGGDSVVYRARDLRLGRSVAVKVLAVDEPHRVERFMREIEITVELGRQHPYVVTVLATGTTASGRPAIVMDFYERGSLHDQLRERGPLGVDEVVAAGRVVADALAFAHAHGVLHRDVKPQNVLVLPTSWVLADFGIARLVDTEHTASVETFTYRHASPQLLDGAMPTEADDVWALGSTLFTLLDGRAPFASDDPDDDSALAYLRRVRTSAHRRPDLGPAQREGEPLLAVIDRCLAKDLDQRWGSAAELRDALSDLRATAWRPDAAARPLAPAPAPVELPVEPPAASEAPVEPKPVALSVLAHRDAAGEDAATSARPPEPESAPEPPVEVLASPRPEPDAPPDPQARSRRRLLIGLAALALLVGTGLSVVGAALRSGDDDTTSTAQPTTDVGGEAVPTLDAAPTETGDPQVKVFDPALTFDFTGIRSDGVSIEMNWNDPTDGRGTFVLLQTLPTRDLRQFPPGTREATLTVPLAQGERACFKLTVLDTDGAIGEAAQNPRCVRPTAP